MKVPEEPCQCPDCLRFYREHDRLIREFPTLRKQQEINWAALQSFRTLCGRVLEDLQKKLNSNSANTSEENLKIGTNQKKEKSLKTTQLFGVNGELKQEEHFIQVIISQHLIIHILIKDKQNRYTAIMRYLKRVIGK